MREIREGTPVDETVLAQMAAHYATRTGSGGAGSGGVGSKGGGAGSKGGGVGKKGGASSGSARAGRTSGKKNHPV